MAVIFQMTSNGELVAAEVGRVTGEIETTARHAPVQLAETIAGIYEPALIGNTPIATGQLVSSTTHDLVSLGSETTIFFRQPASSPRGYKYAWAVVFGHRVVVHGRDTGKRTAANPYPLRTWDEVDPEVRSALAGVSVLAITR